MPRAGAGSTAPTSRATRSRSRTCLSASSAAAAIGDYTDFFASVFHATNTGSMFRPDNPLLPNFKYVPVGYHGRASSVRPSGQPVRRPLGQARGPNDAEPRFGPSRNLDYEAE